jgi:hypothetical protein
MPTIKYLFMGKKKKSKKSFLKQNKIMLAALGGVATGISLAGILGTEKARKIVDTLGSSVNEFTNKLKDQMNKKSSDIFPTDQDIKSRRQAQAEPV